MDRDIIEGKWTEIKGRVREAYGELTDDEIEEARGNRQKLEGLIQQRAGKTKDEAREAVDSMLDKV
ncbi:CsbD family protein [Tropicibacter naphthalenivorans]|uniref:CsbD-like protein n=1 Tax=Tropicibacter naphthalenivorans TaxID=441103 RepID=A0A0P1GLT1_9RHOB|nr:CsbD family protein [Tropicibacter naphthalenivorans]CUH75644.1 CsbD-like protein [Tropicibacter naphthalenivorans]SMC43037.1 Uncharacterized conserved protein YjbJ, UPF0337 family [Tropicibacter naphthalenivorans]